jgi:hypothetical protein
LDVNDCEEDIEQEEKVQLKIEKPKTEKKQLPTEKSFLEKYGNLAFILALLFIGVVVFTITAILIFKK